MQFQRRMFIYIAVLLVFVNTSLFAYIDPGTGSLLVSTLLGLGLVLLYSVKNVVYRVLASIYGKGVKGNNDFTGKLVFFNEGKNYWYVFKPVIDELSQRNISFVYLSADKDDPGLQLTSPFIESHYIGNIHTALLVLKNLKAKMCVMTTPQLNILMLRRSKEVQHYCHIVHSPDDIHTYKKFAFDYFDSVLCSSSFQIDNLRELEALRNKPKKLLLETGCSYYDCVANRQHHNTTTELTILLAPTWGEKSFLSQQGEQLLDSLLEEGYNVIFRPHPQSWISDKALIENIITRYDSISKFSIDSEVDNNRAMAQSNCMVCDLSGIVYDYVFVHKKPVIAVIIEQHLKGYEGYNLSKEQSVISLLNKAGKAIHISDLPNITQLIKSLPTVALSKETIDNHVFNYGRAGKVAVDQILQIFANLDTRLGTQ